MEEETYKDMKIQFPKINNSNQKANIKHSRSKSNDILLIK